MKGFPKVIKTKSDLVNTFKLVKRGRLEKEDWLAVEKLENQNWIMCPVIELSEDRKTVTIMYCAEVEEGQKIKNGAVYPTVQGIKIVHINKDTGEEQTAAENLETGQNNDIVHTVLSISKALNMGSTEIGIPAEVTFYDRLGITEEEVEAMKGELA